MSLLKWPKCKITALFYGSETINSGLQVVWFTLFYAWWNKRQPLGKFSIFMFNDALYWMWSQFYSGVAEPLNFLLKQKLKDDDVEESKEKLWQLAQFLSHDVGHMSLSSWPDLCYFNFVMWRVFCIISIKSGTFLFKFCTKQLWKQMRLFGWKIKAPLDSLSVTLNFTTEADLLLKRPQRRRTGRHRAP